MMTRLTRLRAKQGLFWSGLLGVLLLAGCSDASEEQDQGQARDRGVIVEIAEARAQDVDLQVRGIGTLRAVEQVTLRPEVAGRVSGLHFVEGGRVDAGQLLVELDSERAEQHLAARQAALQSIDAELQDVRRTLDRQRELRDRDLTSQGELDRVETQYQRAVAERERLLAERAQAVRDVEDSRILAPFDGVIGEREVDRGSYVAVGEALATVYRIDPVEIRFSIPERYLSRLALEQTVRLQLADDGDAFEGTLSYISPAVEGATRSVTVRARIPNANGMLRPGLFATAFVVLETRKGQITIPDDALVATRHGYIVYVVDDDNVANRREVSTGVRQNDWVEVRDGLQAGERVIWRGHMRVDDGSRVYTEDDGAEDA